MSLPMRELEDLFGPRLQLGVRFSNYTTSRVGGPIAGLLPVNTLKEFSEAAQKLWEMNVPFRVLGSGSNLLVSDNGYNGIMLLNRCHNIKIWSQHEPPTVFAESGANLGNMARQTALRGLTGLEWANSIPGSVGGAVYGNAGAHGSDISETLIHATLLLKDEGEKDFTPEDMQYTYRSSFLKHAPVPAVILSAVFEANTSTREKAWKRLTELTEKRRSTQPTGASVGSTFKNPPGNYAGRLLEAVGMKGVRIGNAEFSRLHANFIVNDGTACATDYYQLIRLAQKRVRDQFGIELELEVELLGDFDD